MGTALRLLGLRRDIQIVYFVYFPLDLSILNAQCISVSSINLIRYETKKISLTRIVIEKCLKSILTFLIERCRTNIFGVVVFRSK